MTLKDIARLAGVAPSTVSRVLSQPESSAASAETRARIWEIVRANGYTPPQCPRAADRGRRAEEPLALLHLRPLGRDAGRPLFLPYRPSNGARSFRAGIYFALFAVSQTARQRSDGHSQRLPSRRRSGVRASDCSADALSEKPLQTGGGDRSQPGRGRL